jgi:GNAT superfamily N-acetyltransferase
MNTFTIRFATSEDTPIILNLIRSLAEYEKLSHQVVATVESLHKWLFVEKMAEVLIGEVNHQPIGFALFFYNFSTFLGKPGLYLEDLYIEPASRHLGYGKRFFTTLATIALERDCGRLEWACLDWNKPSIDFYQSLGARPLADWTIYRLDVPSMEQLTK